MSRSIPNIFEPQSQFQIWVSRLTVKLTWMKTWKIEKACKIFRHYIGDFMVICISNEFVSALSLLKLSTFPKATRSEIKRNVMTFRNV